MSTTIADLPGVRGTDWDFLRSPEMTLDDNGQGGYISSVAFWTNFSQLATFVTKIAGTSQTITTSWGSFLRVVPMQHPLFSGLLARRVKCKATGEHSGTSTYNQMYSRAKVIVDFESVLYGTTGDQAYMSLEVEKGATYTTQPGRKFAFSSGEPIDQDAGAWAVTNNYVITLFQCPQLHDDYIDLAAGKINNATFLGRPAGTMLFGGCRGMQTISTGGVITYQRSLSFAYRSYSWNQAYNRAGTLDTPLDPAGNPQYANYDFNNLFN